MRSSLKRGKKTKVGRVRLNRTHGEAAVRITITREELRLVEVRRLLLAISDNDIRMGTKEERDRLHEPLAEAISQAGANPYDRLIERIEALRAAEEESYKLDADDPDERSQDWCYDRV